jgi:hypothetical protein
MADLGVATLGEAPVELVVTHLGRPLEQRRQRDPLSFLSLDAHL